MAGATNRAMKAAGLPKATQEKIRVARGAGLTVQSAIQHAQAHGLPLGKAAKHVGELSGWQKAAAGAKVEARPATKRAPGESLEAYRARDLTSRDPATMRAAIREQIKKIRSDAGGEADVQRLSTMLQSRNAAAKQRTAERGGQQDLFGANPAPRGPSPFEVRAKAAAERRAAMVASAQQRAGRLPQALGGAARGMMAARKAAREEALLSPFKNTKVGGKDATEWSSEMSLLRERKPRPLNKLYRNPALITPEIKAKHDMVTRAWNALYRTASKNQKKALDLSNSACRSATPAQQAAHLRSKR